MWPWEPIAVVEVEVKSVEVVQNALQMMAFEHWFALLALVVGEMVVVVEVLTC